MGDTPEAAAPEIRSEGQRLLLELAESQQKIADAIGMSRPIVSFWRSGKNVPGTDARHMLWKCYGIHPTAWEVPPGGAYTPAPILPAYADPVPESDTASMSILDLLNRRIRGYGRMVDSEDESIGPDLRLRAGELERKCIAERRALERDQRAHEADVVARSKEWAEIRKRTLAVLRQYPDAFRAWTEAMGDLAKEKGPIPDEEESDE